MRQRRMGLGIILLAGAIFALAAGARAGEATTRTQTSALPGMGREVPGLKIGEAAPDFQCATLDGDELALKDLRGKVVLVEFWAVWCGWCVRETPAMKALHEEFGKDKRFVMIGMNVDRDLIRLENYLKKEGIKWPQCLLGDWAKDKTTLAYGVREIPTLFLIGPDGKILAKTVKGKEIRDAVAKALGKKESSGAQEAPAAVAMKTAPALKQDLKASTAPPMPYMIRDNGGKVLMDVDGKPLMDPNDPNATPEERLARQKKLILSRLAARQKQLEKTSGH